MQLSPNKCLPAKSIVSLLLALAIVALSAGVALAVSGEGGHGAESHGIQWVSTDTYRVFNFVVLVVVLFFVLRKPVSEALNSRITGIKEQLHDLEVKKRQAQKTLDDLSDKLAMLDQEAEKLVAEYVRQGEEAKERILNQAEQAATKLESQAKRSIESEFKQAKEKLQSEILEKAMAKAEEMIKGKISAEDQTRLVDEYLDKVVA